MPTTSTPTASENEVTILARLLGNGKGQFPVAVARYILKLEFSDEDKARMHDLAVRYQRDALSSIEKEELIGYAKAGTMLSILHSKARRVLGVKPKKTKPN